MTSTETSVREWRYGPTQAERLAAGILRLEGFRNIEPQNPLGGGDDGADILCERGQYRWVAAVYFPPTNKQFKDVEAKFLTDLTKAKGHKRNGFVFITNQRLTRGERETLIEVALKEKHECAIYDVERVRGVLDSPEGYGLRVSYLRIPMEAEEQIAFFANRENTLSNFMSEQSKHMADVKSHLEHLRRGQKAAFHTMEVMAKAQNIDLEAERISDPLPIGEIQDGSGEVLTPRILSPSLLRLIHRLVCFDLPPRIVGRFRDIAVVVAKASAAPAQPTFTPPAPKDVPQMIEELCAKWRKEIAAAADRNSKLAAMAACFHGLVYIHPFQEGNGRVARSLLMQQCVEAFGRADMSRLDRGVPYYAALQAADGGDLAPLKALIARISED